MVIRSGEVLAQPENVSIPLRAGAHAIKAEDLPGAEIRAAAFFGNMLVFASEDKALSVWDVSEWKLLFKKETPKKITVLDFSPDGSKILVADKFGDVYSEGASSAPMLILGHVSIITDMIFSTDGRYLITSDRDEKVRVSNYPLCFDVQSFCLGHKLFVTAVASIPGGKNLIVSGGGDSFLLVWDIVSGERVQKISWMDSLSADELKQEDLLVLAIKSSAISNTVAVVINGVKGVLVFRSRNGSHLLYDERISLPDDVLDVNFDGEGTLWGIYRTESSRSLLFKAICKDGKYHLTTDGSLDLQHIQTVKGIVVHRLAITLLVETIPDYLHDIRLLKKLSEEELQERKKIRAEQKAESSAADAEAEQYGEVEDQGPKQKKPKT
ncbi:tRNA (guanine-N(7)-)-methyltransferase non-catalytic subunit trm82 [Phlyctochytrium planicorne]|nr:tRNA (guanine-N(7)-)-methyltransferase non-catalytic subunit trm82 [Phlyctochytrium planicorne]